MAQLIVRNLDDALKERLRRTAAGNGRSMEEEARVILHNALPESVSPSQDTSHVGLGAQLHALFMNIDVPDEYFTAVESIRNEPVVPRAAEFDE